MDVWFEGLSLKVLDQLFFVVISALIPLVLWVMWDLEQRRCRWSFRRHAKNVRRQRSKIGAPISY